MIAVFGVLRIKQLGKIFMIKKYIYVVAFSCLCMYSPDGQASDISPLDVSAICDFNDIFDIDDDEQITVRKYDVEEAEVAALEEFAQEPTPPSEATIVMRQIGLKMLIGYLAAKEYIESMWGSAKKNVTRFRSWVMHEEID
jgi:hypothetical protein